jgi:hypothetical protein
MYRAEALTQFVKKLLVQLLPSSKLPEGFQYVQLSEYASCQALTTAVPHKIAPVSSIVKVYQGCITADFIMAV